MKYSSYWNEGYEAAMRDNEKGCTTVCTYTKDSSEYNDWKDGYSTGMDDWYYAQYV